MGAKYAYIYVKESADVCMFTVAAL